MHWTINHVAIFLYETSENNTLSAFFDTVTPNLDKLMLRIDGGNWMETPSKFSWKLKSGINTLEVKPVNKWGLEGITSEITVKR